jgi:hypothetical protein
METLFKNSGVGGNRTPIAGDETTYEHRVRAMIDDSVDYEESYLARAREENQAYYNGLQPSLSASGDDEEDSSPNRSTFVSTDVRDTILTVMPSLMRVFTNFDQKVADFVPTSEANQDMAEQAYDYINYVFYEDNPGFLILHSVLKDALTVKAGITKWWTDTDQEVQERTFRNISQEQYQYLVYEMPDVEVVDMSEMDEMGLIDSVTFRYVVDKPITRLAAVPPDEFRIARDAKDVESAGLVGHERVVPISELVLKGYDEGELRDHIQSQISYSDERFLRNPGLTDDKSIEGVMYGEWYIRIDGDGDGIAELRHICTLGQNYIIIHDEVVPYSRFALWASDPRPHTAIGDCLADITKDIQRIKTNMMRGQLDNLAESIHPRTVVNELVTNIEDVLSDEVGAVIRTRGDPNAAVAFTKTPYAGADVQVTVDYLDKVRASRTGITEASKGLDPKAMQSTALVGIDAIVSGAQERIELIARILAETGLKATLRGLLREVVDNPNPGRTVKLRGKWADVNPSFYDATMRVQINPTLGKGTDMVRLQALAKVEQTQLTIIQQFGINNPVVTPIEFRNTQVDMLSIANIKNPNRYFKDITPEVMEAVVNQPKEPDPAAVLAQAELEKVKKDIIIESGRFALQQDQMRFNQEKFDREDDFKRDKLNVDTAVKVLDIVMDPKPQTITPGEPTVPAAARQENRPG